MAVNVVVLAGNFSLCSSDSFPFGIRQFLNFSVFLRSILIDINVGIFLCRFGDFQQVSLILAEHKRHDASWRLWNFMLFTEVYNNKGASTKYTQLM